MTILAKIFMLVPKAGGGEGRGGVGWEELPVSTYLHNLQGLDYELLLVPRRKSWNYQFNICLHDHLP